VWRAKRVLSSGANPSGNRFRRKQSTLLGQLTAIFSPKIWTGLNCLKGQAALGRQSLHAAKKQQRHQSGICSLGGAAVELEIKMPSVAVSCLRRERFNASGKLFSEFAVVEFECAGGGTAAARGARCVRWKARRRRNEPAAARQG
jgi:hypothetical protein